MEDGVICGSILLYYTFTYYKVLYLSRILRDKSDNLLGAKNSSREGHLWSETFLKVCRSPANVHISQTTKTVITKFITKSKTKYKSLLYLLPHSEIS